MTASLPTADNPREIGSHRVYFVSPPVLVTIYHGDVSPEEITQLIDTARLAGVSIVATVADLGALGSFGADARKAMLDARPSDLLEGTDADVGVFVVNADVVRRAVMTLVTTAIRLLSKRRVRVRYVETIAEAEAQAQAYAEAIAAGERP
ncbi:MAG: hypothetical protein R3A51_13650 [Nannocystaceae bacterium]|nr:hypothetical protein [Myxococcales bacterium]